MKSLPELLDWLAAAPPGTALDACRLRELLLELSPVSAPQASAVTPPTEPTWREKLWTVPVETRLGVDEVAEAIGRTRSFVYRATSAKTIPHRKLDGELTFVAGEIRTWIKDQEEVIEPGRMERVALSLKHSKTA